MGKQKLSKRVSLKQALREKAIKNLKAYLKPGDTVYTILRHKGGTGMTHYLRLYAILDNRPDDLTWKVAKAIDATYNNKREALIVHGCGFDPNHDAVYHLARALFQDTNALHHQWL